MISPKKEDLERAFKGSWAVFAVTDFGTSPDNSELEYQQGTSMADVASALQVPYLIFSVIEDVEKLSGGKLNVPHFTVKSKIRDYIKEKHPNLKVIYVEPGMYIQNWQVRMSLPKLDDGTVVFALPVSAKTKLHLVDIEDTGPVVRAILSDPEKYVGEDICICGEEIAFEEVPKIFTKVTGIPAIAKSETKEEFRSGMQFFPKSAQDDLFNMFKWFEQYGYYGQKDWRSGQKLTKLNTFEDWLKQSGWKGESQSSSA